MNELNDKRTGQRHFADHLANERTHLAWLRTSFSLIVLGIAINRFSRYLSELQPQPAWSGFTVDERRLGFGMVVFGMSLMLWATIRYTRVSRQIDRGGQYPPAGISIWVITLAVLLMGSASLTWLFWR
jgi:putative membrane protein